MFDNFNFNFAEIGIIVFELEVKMTKKSLLIWKYFLPKVAGDGVAAPHVSIRYCAKELYKNATRCRKHLIKDCRSVPEQIKVLLEVR